MLNLCIAIFLIVMVLKRLTISCLKMGNHKRLDVSFQNLQVLGTAMGTKMAPCYTTLFIGKF